MRRSTAGPPSATRANPVFLPAPHEVVRALVTGFTTPPARPDEPWLHQSLWHSIKVIFWGFLVSSLIGVPLGILCGALPAMARLTEPFIEFFRYLPAPAFGALAVAVLGIEDAPKVADHLHRHLLPAGAGHRQHHAPDRSGAARGGADAGRVAARVLITRVVVPGVITEIYTDMRVLLGWAWTYLIVAELIGVSSGITYFINQQAKYRELRAGVRVDHPDRPHRPRHRRGAGVAGPPAVPWLRTARAGLVLDGRRDGAGPRGRARADAAPAGEGDVVAPEGVARA